LEGHQRCSSTNKREGSHGIIQINWRNFLLTNLVMNPRRAMAGLRLVNHLQGGQILRRLGHQVIRERKRLRGALEIVNRVTQIKKEQVNTSECIMPDIVQENQALATKVNSSVSGMTSNQEVELSKLGFFSTDDIYHTPDTNVEVLEMANPRTKNLNEQAEEDVQILEVKKNS